MGHSATLISLSLITLLIGIGIAAYQLWSADTAQKEGEHSALAARFGGKVRPRPKA